MLSTVLVLGLVYAAAGQKCCLPKQFTVFEGMLTGYVKSGNPIAIEGAMMVYVDQAAKMIAVEELLEVPGEELQLKVIQDFNKGVQYTIMKGKCNNTAIGLWRQQCIPANAEFILGGYFGGGAKLQTKTYEFFLNQSVIDTTVTEDCIPVVTGVYATETDIPFVTTLSYMNYTAEIKDPSVFKVPDVCRKAASGLKFTDGRPARRISSLYTIY